MKRFTVTLAIIFVSLLAFAAAPSPTNAQGVTTGAINGAVLDTEAKPLPGATVRAVHEPTGTQYGTYTRADGRYNLRGLLAGGPYTLSISSVGSEKEERDNIWLSPGQILRIDVSMHTASTRLGEVEVVADRDATFNASRTGAENQLSEEQIESAPTVNRSLQDMARYNPHVLGTNIGSSEQQGGINILGQSSRYNNIQIDGAVSNDVFGLASSGTPGGQANAQPISLDAIQELQVSVAPYDIRNSGFTGGLVNAVTRSGTNSWSASVYSYFRNEGFAGDSPDEQRTPLAEFSDLWVGARVGGPIMHNQLFFFLSAETKRRTDPQPLGINDPDAANNFPIEASVIDEVIAIARDQYGYDAGNYAPYEPDTEDMKIFARLDWNMADNHRLTLRHNFVDANLDRGLTRSATRLSLSSEQYLFTSVNNQTVLQLNSMFGTELANEFRVSFMTVRDNRDWEDFTEPFPYVEIDVGDREDIILGIDRFSHQNSLDQDILEITNDLTYFMGDHVFTVGTHNEIVSFSNLFIQDFYGAYVFDDVEAFRQGNPSRYGISYSNIAGVEAPRAEFSMIQLGFYIQDEWTVSPTLRLNFGIRADLPMLPDEPLNNPIVEQDFGGRYSTSDISDGNLLLAPRLGFNWDLSGGERTTQLRGGTGIFSGKTPAVWISNQYSNTGVDISVTDLVSAPDSLVFSPDPFNQPILPANNTPVINITDPDFKLPQVWRTNIGFDHQLPYGLSAGVDVIFSKFYNQIDYQDVNMRRITDSTGAALSNRFDGRPLYAYSSTGGVSNRLNRVLMLTNKDEGKQLSVTAQIRKDAWSTFLPGISGGIAYTYGESEDINSGTSSRAISNWQFNVTADPNNSAASLSNFDIQHRFVFDLSYALEYLDGWSTTFTLFFEHRSGRPFSYVYNGDANGDGAFSNDLIYVPNSQDEVVMVPSSSSDTRTPDEIWAEFNAFIESDDALKDQRGQIMERNSAREPSIEQLDLRITQQIPTIAGQRLSLTLDILNVLNLLNGDWGHQEYVNFQSYSLATFRGYDDQGRMMLRFTTPETVSRKDNLLSRWQMQLGFRYTL